MRWVLIILCSCVSMGAPPSEQQTKLFAAIVSAAAREARASFPREHVRPLLMDSTSFSRGADMVGLDRVNGDRVGSMVGEEVIMVESSDAVHRCWDAGSCPELEKAVLISLNSLTVTASTQVVARLQWFVRYARGGSPVVCVKTMQLDLHRSSKGWEVTDETVIRVC